MANEAERRRLVIFQSSLVVVLGAAFGLVLALVLAHDEIAFDRGVADLVVAQRRPWLDRVMQIGTWAGSSAVLAPVLAAAGAFLGHVARSWRPLVFLAVSLAGAIALSTGAKRAVSRPRPDDADALVAAFGYGFPSGHATAATAGWIGLALMVAATTPRGRRKVALLAMAILVATLVGISRVYLGVHEPTDVLGGWALGAMWIALIVVATRLHDERRDRCREARDT